MRSPISPPATPPSAPSWRRPRCCSAASRRRCSTGRWKGEAVQARMNLSIARFSRQQEFEADQIGIGVIARAGYDPYAASRFLTSLGRWSALRTAMIGADSADKPDMMATHPSTPERIAQAIVEARKVATPGAGETGRDDYLNASTASPMATIRRKGLVRGSRFLHPKLGFAFAAPDGFALENQSAALIGVGEGGALALRLDNIAVSPSTSLEDELASGWIDGVKTSSIETLYGRRLSDGDRRRAGRSMELPARRGQGRRPRLPPDLRRACAHPGGRRALSRFDPLVPSHHARRKRARRRRSICASSRRRRATPPRRWRARMSPEERADRPVPGPQQSRSRRAADRGPALQDHRAMNGWPAAPPDWPPDRRDPQSRQARRASAICSRPTGSKLSAPARSASPSRRRPATVFSPTRR